MFRLFNVFLFHFWSFSVNEIMMKNSTLFFTLLLIFPNKTLKIIVRIFSLSIFCDGNRWKIEFLIITNSYIELNIDEDRERLLWLFEWLEKINFLHHVKLKILIYFNKDQKINLEIYAFNLLVTCTQTGKKHIFLFVVIFLLFIKKSRSILLEVQVHWS